MDPGESVFAYAVEGRIPLRIGIRARARELSLAVGRRGTCRDSSLVRYRRRAIDYISFAESAAVHTVSYRDPWRTF